MPQYSQHKKDGDSWFSQPFYSAPGGYKLCLSVDVNGQGNGQGTHISMFVCLMKGDDDDQLQWPFEHRVTYGMINWKRDEHHVIKTTNFKIAPKQCKERVTSKKSAEMTWGYSKFLPHSSLTDGADIKTEYLHNDCLCLQVLKVEPPK